MISASTSQGEKKVLSPPLLPAGKGALPDKIGFFRVILKFFVRGGERRVKMASLAAGAEGGRGE